MNATHSTSCKRQRGFTLIELMTASAVSLVLLGVISQIYLGARVNYKYQTATARIQEAGRFAIEIMGQDARSAGFQGCGSVGITANTIANSTSSWWLDTTSPVRGYDSSLGFPAQLSSAVTSSDAVVFIRADSVSERLVTTHDPVAATFTVSSTHNYEPGEVIFVTDCDNAAFFQMTGPATPTHTTLENKTGVAGILPGNCHKELGSSCGATAISHTFSAGSLLSRIVSNAYYIAPASNGNGNSLWVSTLSRTGTSANTISMEMVPGVQAMRLLYGVNNLGDPDSSADRYLRANEVESQGQRTQIVSLRIEFLVRSEEDNLASAAHTYTFDGQSVTPTDKRLYRVYSTTVNLRNRTT